MNRKGWLNWEVFLHIAETSGLDIKDPHINDLYAYIEEVFPGLKKIEELDLTDIEPVMPSSLFKE